MTLMYQIGYANIWHFLILTVLLGGGLALAGGHWLGARNKSRWLLILCGLIISIGIAYIRNQWLQDPMIIFYPIFAASNDLGTDPLGASRAIFWFLRGWLIVFIALSILALIGYSRSRPMNPAS